MKKITYPVVFILLAVFLLKQETVAMAAKKFVPKSAPAKKVTYSKIPSTVRYKPDRRGIYFSFLNFSGINSVSYSFTYDTNGNRQGAGGVVSANNNPLEQRELLFGTCSTSVCTYHTNITNAKLTLTAVFTNGKKASKVYRIKSYL